MDYTVRAVKKIKRFMFNIHEAVWWVVAEIEDWLYPYHDRLSRLQDQMLDVQQQLARHEEKLKFKVKKVSESPSVSGAVRKMKVPD